MQIRGQKSFLTKMTFFPLYVLYLHFVNVKGTFIGMSESGKAQKVALKELPRRGLA